jgi:chemotaxis protein methyltransferase CheR
MSEISRPSRAVETLARLLEQQSGQQLSESRLWRIETALRPLLRSHGLPSLDELVHALGRTPSGPMFHEVIDLMLNHESSFFRDLAVFQSLETAILPRLAEQLPEKRLRIWCAGCATGKEAYSVAMALRHMGEIWDGWRISIVATDVSPVAIEAAKRGTYAQIEVQRGLGIGDLLRWFSPAGDNWQISGEIRDMVSFHADNLLEPRVVSGEFDLILCRNVLFYFPEDKRRVALRHIAARSHPGSYLVLGAGETLIGQASSFSPCREHRCIYCNGPGDRAHHGTAPDTPRRPCGTDPDGPPNPL